jgi:hypothetical protein
MDIRGINNCHCPSCPQVVSGHPGFSVPKAFGTGQAGE